MKTKITLLVVSFMCLFNVLKAQLYQQTFPTDSTAFSNRAMVNGTNSYSNTTSTTNAQMTHISSSSASNTVAVTSGRLFYTRNNGGNGYGLRNSNFTSSANGATTLYLECEINNTTASSTNTTAFTFWVGNGFANSNAVPSNITGTFNLALSTSGTPGIWKVGSNTPTYSGNRKLVWVLNRGASSIKYQAPNGTEATLASNSMDLWVATVGTTTATRELNNVALTSSTQAIQNFGFRTGATGNPTTWSLDNFLVDSVPTIPTSSAATSVTNNSFTANWSTITGVTGYYIDVATDASFTNLVSGYSNLFVSGQSTNSTNITGLAGGTYFYRVRGGSSYTVNNIAGGNSSSQSVTLTCVNPTINNQPSTSAQSICSGGSLTALTINASGATSYQWYSNATNSNSDGTLISGATSSSYTPSNITPSALYYYCIVSSGASCNVNSSQSGLITVNPNPTPTFISAPSGTIAINNSFTYSTEAGNTNYVWTFTGTNGVDYTISSGGTTGDNSVNIIWLTAGLKTVTVNYTNATSCSGVNPVSRTVTVSASVFYNKPNSDVTITSNWGINTDGTGSAPINFTDDGQTFNLNNSGATMNASWTVNGIGTKVVIGSSNTFTASNDVTAAIDLSTNSTIILQTAVIPTFGFIGSNSTIEYGGTSITQAIAPLTYSNLTLSGTGTRTFSGTTNISGTFNPGSGFSATSGTIVLNGTSSSQIIPAFDYNNLTVSGVDGKSTSGLVNVANTLTMNNSFTIPVGSTLKDSIMSSVATKVLTVSGTFDMNRNSLTFSAGSGSITVAAGGVFRMSGVITSNSSYAFTNINFTSGIGAAGSTLHLATLGCPRIPASPFNGNITYDLQSTGGIPNLYNILNVTPVTITGNMNILGTGGCMLTLGNGGTGRVLNVSGNVNMSGAARFDLAGNGVATGGSTSGGASTLNITGNLNITSANDTLYCSHSTNSSGSGTINISGNLINSSNGQIGRSSIATGSGTVGFVGSTLQDITCSTPISNGTGVTLNNINGARLLTNLSLNGLFTFTNGKLRTNNNSLIMQGSTSTFSGANASNYVAIVDGSGNVATTGGLQIENIGSGGRTTTVSFPIGTNTTYNPATVNNSSTAVTFTARVNSTPYPGTTSDSTVARTWNIQPASGSPTAVIGLQWNANEEGVNFNRASASIGHFDGTKTDVYSNGGASSGLNPYSLSSGSTIFTTFGDFGLIPGIIIPANEPTVQASAVSVTTTTSTTSTLNWTVGNGSHSIVVIKQGSATNAAPIDGLSYTDGSAVFASGSNLGNGNYVAYIGTGNSVTVSGLSLGTTYHFAVYSFNGSNAAENYLTTSPAIANGATIIPTYYYVGGAGNAAGVFTLTLGSANVWATSVGGTPLSSFTPTSNDVLIFDGSNLGGGYTDTVNIAPISPTSNAAKILLTNGAKVKIQMNGGRTINIGNSSFAANTTVLDIPTNAYLFVSGSTCPINLQTNGSANVSGKLYLGTGNNIQLLPAASGSTISFNSGSYCESNQSSSTSAPFGTTGNGIVTFASGSTFKSVKGQEPFGGSGANVASFATGSLCWLNGGSSNNMTLDGRTFGHLQTDYSLSPTGGASGSSNSNGFTINGDLTITSGTLTIAATGTNNSIKGNINISTGATLRFSPAVSTPTTLNFNGTTTQTITNNGTWSLSSTSSTPGTGSEVSYLVNNGSGLILAGTGGTLAMSSVAGTSFTLNSGNSLALNGGTITMNAGTLNINGGLTRTNGTITATNTSCTVNVNGAANIPAGTFVGGQVANLNINRAGGVSIGSDITILTNLSLTNGVVDMGNNTMIISASKTVTRGNGWINGALRKNFGTGSGITRTYEIGDASSYLPVFIRMNSVTAAGDLSIRTQTPATSFANYSTAPISNTNFINRYWTLSNASTALAFTSYNASFNWVAGDAIGTATSSSVLGARFVSSWSKSPAFSTGATSDSISTQTGLGTLIFADDCITLTPSVSITSTTTAVCSGSSVTFTAIPVNPGSSPIYQWKKNGTTNIGTNSTTLTLQDFEVTSGDAITCVMVPNNVCQTLNSVTSNSIGLIVGTVTPAITISTASNNVCSNDAVTFNANGVNPGPSPIYQWMRNGVNLTTGNSITFAPNTLNNNDVITCKLTANNPCQTLDTITSNAISMTVKQSPAFVGIYNGANNALISSGQVVYCNWANQLSFYVPSNVRYGTWSSSNPAIVTLNNGSNTSGLTSSGTITTLSNGTTTIKYTLPSTIQGNSCTTESSITIIVARQETPSSISGNTNLCLGDTATYTTSSTGGVWALNGRGTINSSGFATFTSAGNVNATYTITNANNCSATAVLPIVINALPAMPNIGFASGNTVNPFIGAPSGNMCRNRTFRLVGLPAGGTWSSTGSTMTLTPLSTTPSTIAEIFTGTSSTAQAASITYTVASSTNAACKTRRTIITPIFPCATKGSNNTISATSNKWSIYPNPVTGKAINIKTESLFNDSKLEVVDIYGKVVLQLNINQQSTTINNNLAKGIYFIKMNGEVKKIVIE